MRFSSKKIFLLGAAVFLIGSFYGCDQISKITDYFAPGKTALVSSSPEKNVKQQAAAPMVKAPIQQKKAQEPEVAAPDTLAQIGSWVLSKQDFHKRLEAVKTMMPDFDAANLDQQKYILSELIQQQLLVQEALSQGLDKTEEVQAAIDDLRNTVLVQALLAKISEGVDVTDQEVEVFYNDNPDFFRLLTEWRVREIVVNSDEEAKAVLVALNQGEGFEDLARARSISASAAQGGDLGFLTIPTGDPNLDSNTFAFEKMAQIVTALDIGEVSGAFKGPEGTYIVKLMDKKGGELQPFDEINEDLKVYLVSLKQQERVMEALAAAEEKFKVIINEELLEK